MANPTVQPSPDASGIVWDSQPAQPATQSGPDASGIVWDKQPTQPAQTSQAPAPQSSSEIQINPSDSLLTKAAKTVGGLFEGAGEGVLSTVTGTDQWAREHLPAFLTNSDLGFGAPANLENVKQLSGNTGAPHGIAQSVGRVGEDLAEFVLGDSALKGLSVSDRLLQASKYAKMVEESPILTRIFQAGVRAVRSGAVAGGQTGAKTGNADAAIGTGVGAGVTAGVVPEIPNAIGTGIKAIRKPFSLQAVQDALEGSKGEIQEALQGQLQNIQDQFHGAVRDLFDSVAKDAGVSPKPAASLHDVASSLSDAVKQKASAVYKQLDNAVGGTRFQTFDEQLSNVKRALRNSAGIDPDADGRLIERINQLEDAKAKALEVARENGVDPELIHKANATHQQAMALSDLSKAVQSSITGLRADIANGVNAAQESLSPAKLTNKVNRLFNTGRLQQAIGEDRAGGLLQAIETTKQTLQDAATSAAKQTEAAVANAAQKADAVKTRKVIAGTVGGATLAGVPGFALLKHLLGE